MGILYRLTGFKWAAATGIMRLTADALVYSRARYGLAMIDSGAYEESFRKLGFRLTYVFVHKESISPIAHAVTGALAIRNMYLQGRASTADQGRRAERSALQKRRDGQV